jgi:hypothetical protein
MYGVIISAGWAELADSIHTVVWTHGLPLHIKEQQEIIATTFSVLPYKLVFLIYK